MKQLLWLLLLAPSLAFAQGSNVGTASAINKLNAQPSPCVNAQVWYNVSNNNSYICISGTAVLLASGGGGGNVSGSGTANTVPKWTGTGTIGNSSITDTGSASTRTPNGINTAGAGLSQEYANANPGTALNKVFVINNSQQAVTATVSQTSGIAGVAIAGAGTTGNVTGCITQCSVLYDNQTTIGHIAIVSTSSAGELHDTGGTSQVGTGVDTFLIDSVNSGAATVALTDLLTPRNISAQSTSAGGKTTVQVNGSPTQPVANFNDTTPTTATNGYNIKWQSSDSGKTTSASGYVPGYGTIKYGFSYQGAVGASATGLIQVASAATLPANLATPTTTCVCGTNPTSTFAITLKDGASTIGSISIAGGGCVATLTTTGGTTQALAADDQLYAIAPGSADATAANISCLVRASRN